MTDTNDKQKRLETLGRKIARLLHEDIQVNGKLNPSATSPKFWAYVQRALVELEQKGRPAPDSAKPSDTRLPEVALSEGVSPEEADRLRELYPAVKRLRLKLVGLDESSADFRRLNAQLETMEGEIAGIESKYRS